MDELRVIKTPNAPAAIGPYSQGLIHAGVLYSAGQVAFDPATGQIVGEGIAEQTEQVLRNLGGVLEAAGASFQSVLKTTVFLRDMNDFAEMNDVYARFFGDHRPARTTVQAARLPRDVAVEIELIAAVTGGASASSR